MKVLLVFLLPVWLSSCQTARLLPTASAILPINNGYVIYQQVDTLRGVTMPEINRVAQAWIKEHTLEYAFEWQPPVYKAELMYAGQIRPEKIQPLSSEYYTKRHVNYLLTVSAKEGVCRLLLTNFDVAGIERETVPLERLVSDRALSESVNREATVLLTSMSRYIRRNANQVTLR